MRTRLVTGSQVRGFVVRLAVHGFAVLRSWVRGFAVQLAGAIGVVQLAVRGFAVRLANGATILGFLGS